MLFNEPKLLKFWTLPVALIQLAGFSALQRAEIAEIKQRHRQPHKTQHVSVLFNEPKLLKSCACASACACRASVSVLFNEPKLLKSRSRPPCASMSTRFSALQRAEIAEIPTPARANRRYAQCFSALQRAEIAEIQSPVALGRRLAWVSVLFNEPKLLKSRSPKPLRSYTSSFSALQRAEIAEIAIRRADNRERRGGFSALQRAEIAEILLDHRSCAHEQMFQCSSTSRNC